MATEDTSSTPFDEDAEAREFEAFFRRQDPVNTAAVDWHTRMEEGLDAAGQAELQQWLAANPAHAAAFKRLDQDLAALRAIPLENAATIRTPRQNDQPGQNGTNPAASQARAGAWPCLHGLRPRWSLAAFCCMTLLAAGLAWHQWNSPQTFSGNYVVKRGKSQTIALPDGTELALDAETQARATLYQDRREVRLEEGQIMFAVAPDREKPFHILAGSTRVTVVGTRFSVRYRQTGMDAGLVRVAVEEGHVQVSDTSRGVASAAAIDLTAGQGLAVSPAGGAGPVETFAPGSVALWRKGMVRFDSTPLGDALLELERYGSTGLTIRDPSVAAMPISGSFQLGRPQEFARMTTHILPVRLVQDPTGKTEIAKAL